MFIKIGNLRQEEYKGIMEMAAYGLHRKVAEMISPYISSGMEVIDFGCGRGAFSQRLADMGLVVDGCDIDTDQIMATVRNKIKLDLNSSDISETVKQEYDMVIAMEIIEHLHNPWKYIGDCVKILRNGGYIVFSTPNISSFSSRLRFFMRGTLTAFEKNDLAHGHITPLSYIQIENIFESFGLEIVKKGYAGEIPFIHLFGVSLFSLLRNTVLPFFYPFMSGPKKGRALVYIVRKK